MTVEEVIVTKKYNIYVSIDGRKFHNKDDCLTYEKWLETNTRNIPTKEQFDSLKKGDKVCYCGVLMSMEYPPNHFGEDIANITDGGWCDEEVHYTELDLVTTDVASVKH